LSVIALCLTAGFGGLVLLGFPFAIAIGLAITAALLTADIEPAFLAQSVISGAQQFSLLAIPLFMFAGELMTESGVTQRDARDLWDAPAVFLALVLLLGAEWTWRRYRGLA